jgi:D-glycero-D-manno-heptose 1,7-bisphosphate phosphatase
MSSLLERWQINSSWSLFLDRDGVLNEEKHQDYIRHESELILYPGVAESIAYFNRLFQLVLVVTNQRGISKGFMTEEDLHRIHATLSQELSQHQGQIHRYYFAPDLETDAINRKPNIGMGLQAKNDFPEIDFSKSIMVGNNLSDMEFGKRLGMKTVYVQSTKPIAEEHEWVDCKVASVLEMAKLLGFSTP